MRKKVVTSSFISGALKSKLSNKIIDHFYVKLKLEKILTADRSLSKNTSFDEKCVNRHCCNTRITEN